MTGIWRFPGIRRIFSLPGVVQCQGVGKMLNLLPSRCPGDTRSCEAVAEDGTRVLALGSQGMGTGEGKGVTLIVMALPPACHPYVPVSQVRHSPELSMCECTQNQTALLLVSAPLPAGGSPRAPPGSAHCWHCTWAKWVWEGIRRHQGQFSPLFTALCCLLHSA